MRPTAELASEGAPAQPSTSDSAGPAPWRPGGARREAAAPPSGMPYVLTLCPCPITFIFGAQLAWAMYHACMGHPPPSAQGCGAFGLSISYGNLLIVALS